MSRDQIARLIKTGLFIIGYSVLGYLLNQIPLSIAYGLSFIFGGVFVFISLSQLGLFSGTLTAFGAAIYTWILWHHPYAIIIWTIEALFVGYFYHKRKFNLIIADTLFWTLIGIPLVIVIYHYPLNNPLSDSSLVGLKQALNGILNVLIADIIVTYLPLINNKSKFKPTLAVKKIFFQFTSFFIIIPSLSGVVYIIKKDNQKAHENLSQLYQSQIHEIESQINHWLNTHKLAVQNLSLIGQKHSQTPSHELQHELSLVKDLMPDFHNVYLANKAGTTYAFYPPLNDRGESTIGLNFSDRPYYQKLKTEKQMVISNIFQGRGGTFSPIFTICTPILKKDVFSGFALAAVNVDKLKSFLKSGSLHANMYLTLTDQDNKIIASTYDGRNPLTTLNLADTNKFQSIHDSISIRTPNDAQKGALIAHWRNSYYYSSEKFDNLPWTIHIETPVMAIQSYHFQNTLMTFLAVFLIFLFSVPILFWATQFITTPIERLTEISSNLPSSVAKQTDIAWPQTFIQELKPLIQNFSQAEEVMKNQFREITEANKSLELKVKARTALLEIQNKKYRSFFEKNKAVMLLLDPKSGQILDANESAIQFYGWTLDELKNMKISDINNLPETVVSENMKKASETNSLIFQFQHRRKKGDTRHVEVFATPFDVGNEHFIMSIIHDIEEKYQTEKIVEEQKLKMIDSSRLTVLGEMAGGIAHEINNPLAIISGDTFMLNELGQKLAPNERDYILKHTDRIDATVLRITKIIKGLRAFARGSEKDPFMQSSVRTIIEQTLSFCQAKFRSRGMDVKIEIHPDSEVQFECRETQISQVLLNLLSNAYDALDGVSNPQLNIKTSLKDSNHIQIRVLDNGSGIPIEIEKKILEPFFTTKAVGKGTGLGLSISKGIIDDHGGKLYIDRSENLTCFVIELPIKHSSSI